VEYRIREFEQRDMDDIITLSLLAWEPVFASFERIMGPGVFPLVYPDWRTHQAETVEKACSNNGLLHILVAEQDEQAVGFLAYKLLLEKFTGEIYLLAVHPEFQNHGIGTELNLAALKAMKTAGMKVAAVGTGGDEGHAPARRSYEKAGFTPLPLVRYYKAL
jgi:ribosomal protein S18 acetylase RimI-like enzyme